MGLRIVPGTAGRPLAGDIARVVRAEPVTCELERFPDGELRPVVEDVRDADVYVVQPTGPPVSDHLIELFLLLDACRRGGAERITAVVPYFGYARQDRRSRAGEAVGARVVADAVAGPGPSV
jgi:ribose-phosphate pyrophosphokinase